jgi:hypothetical protein
VRDISRNTCRSFAPAYYGIDLSERAIKQAQRRCPNSRSAVGEPLALSFANVTQLVELLALGHPAVRNRPIRAHRADWDARVDREPRLRVPTMPVQGAAGPARPRGGLAQRNRAGARPAWL